jgi:predicted GIY-YIG superfamily endonuclease
MVNDKNPTVYMIANKPHGVIYTGVTSDIDQLFQIESLLFG